MGTIMLPPPPPTRVKKLGATDHVMLGSGMPVATQVRVAGLVSFTTTATVLMFTVGGSEEAEEGRLQSVPHDQCVLVCSQQQTAITASRSRCEQTDCKTVNTLCYRKLCSDKYTTRTCAAGVCHGIISPPYVQYFWSDRTICVRINSSRGQVFPKYLVRLCNINWSLSLINTGLRMKGL